MLLFSTVLSIKETMTKDDFIQLAIEWNQGSPHPENIIPDIKCNGERNIRYGTDDLWLAIEEYRNKNTIAIRYEKTESDGVVWDTDYVKAAAVTAGFACAGAAPKIHKVVELNRPFVYAIMHDEMGLPVFTGIVNML